MTRTILVVEDTREFQLLIRSILEGAGYEVVIAGTGTEGLAEARRLKPDLVLLDIQLPGMDGYDVCGAIRADPEIGRLPIIVVSVQSQVSEIIRAMKRGADDYVAKPYDPRQVLTRVAGLLDAAADRRGPE